MQSWNGHLSQAMHYVLFVCVRKPRDNKPENLSAERSSLSPITVSPLHSSVAACVFEPGISLLKGAEAGGDQCILILILLVIMIG